MPYRSRNNIGTIVKNAGSIDASFLGSVQSRIASFQHKLLNRFTTTVTKRHGELWVYLKKYHFTVG